MQPLFPGTSELNQLKMIFQQLGTPSENVWPGYSALPLTSEVIFDQHPPGGLRKEIKRSLLSDSGLSLLEQFLIYDPSRRLTATEALLHPYFDEQPVAIEPAMFLSSLELEYVDLYDDYDMDDDVHSSGFETEEYNSSYSGYPVGSSEYNDDTT
ncbi:cyclin-dependent kinase 11B-like [Spodoptera litura]|uniref:Cyclin-dependent kinase 11B-like n=1 Tax=Spodoptera litura TaxID=69820 RepID=A0A9J7EV01_SPOLT|nr:cyclin-dependent kinase 11B-like [Spodoptera litura]